jgi:hypothetical protein
LATRRADARQYVRVNLEAIAFVAGKACQDTVHGLRRDLSEAIGQRAARLRHGAKAALDDVRAGTVDASDLMSRRAELDDVVASLAALSGLELA